MIPNISKRVLRAAVSLAILAESLSTLSWAANGTTPTITSAVTLSQCYEWAKAQNEGLRILGEDIRQSDARARAALGASLPRLDYQYDHTWQDPRGVEKTERKGFGGFSEKSQAESKFSIEQPLFSGFQEFSARSDFQKESARTTLRLRRAATELFEKTADVFYAVVDQETQAANTRTAVELAEDRVKELGEFFRLGKARESELFTARAHAAALRAQLDQTEAGIGSARAELSFLTGQDVTTASLVDQITGPPQVATLDESLALARDRSDLKAQKEEVDSKKARVRYERGAYWPLADVTGNYYTQRSTFLKDIDWDVIFSLEVPIYQGGTVAARVREASSVYRQALLTYQELERSVVFSIRQVHGELLGAIKESKSLEEAATAAQRSYESLRKEYRLGLVENLDVLQALDLLQSQKSARDAARIKAKRLFIRLQAASGEMNP